MATHITQCENLRNTQIARDGMVSGFVLRKMGIMKRDRLIAARKRLKVTQEVIAERLDVSVAQVSRWENGKDGIPSQRLPFIAQAYESTIGELFDGEATPDIPPSNAKVVRFEGAPERTMARDLPVYGTSLGAPREFDGKAIEQTMLNSGTAIEYRPRPVVLEGQRYAYGLYVQGTSMAPRFEDGEMVFASDSRHSRPARIGDDVIVYVMDPSEPDDGESACAVLVKRLVRRTASYIELEQFNPAGTFKIDLGFVRRVDRVYPWGELLS